MPRPVMKKDSGGMFRSVVPRTNRRVCLYGTGGIGKTSLALSAPGPVAFFDFDNSLSVLDKSVTSDVLVAKANDWQSMIDALLETSSFDEVKTICIDSVTQAEVLSTEWVTKNIPHEKGHKVKRIEDYGYGKGYTHIYEQWLKLFAVLDRHVAAGKNVILVAHEITATCPNPSGEDYIRYEPRLQNASKSSTRNRMKEWCDDVLFVGYDIEVSDKKATAKGTRTIYPVEQPICLAKSRKLDEAIVYHEGDDALWNLLFDEGN